MKRDLLVATTLAIAVGCGSSGGARPDASTGDGRVAEDAGFVIAEPALATLPEWECPAGWTALPETGCEPWPVDVAPCAGEAETRFPGSIECTRVGGECAADGWPTGLPTDVPIVWVRAGAPAGGDGTRDSPFSTIAAGMAAAASGTIIAVAVGSYSEPVSLGSDRTLWGACAETRIVSIAGPALTLAGSGAVARNLRLELGSLSAATSITASIEDVLVDRAPSVGVVASNGASLRLARVLIRDPHPTLSGPGRGASVQSGSSVELDRVVIERANETGIFVNRAPSSVVARDVVIRDMEVDGSGEFGDAIDVRNGGQATFERLVVDRARRVGLITSFGGSLTVSDVVVRDTLPTALAAGIGAIVEPTATMTIRRGAILRMPEVGVGVPGGTLTLEDVVVADAAPPPGATYAWGVVMKTGATAALTRVALLRNRYIALDASEAETHLTAADVTIADTRPSEGAPNASLAASVRSDASATIERLTLSGNAAEGVFVTYGGSLTATDVVVEDTQPNAEGAFGRALTVQQASLDVVRSRLERNHDIAIYASGPGTMLRLADLVVRDTVSAPSGHFGRGLEVNETAAATVERASFERNHEVTVLALGSGTSLALADVVVRETLPRPCAPACNPVGTGIAAVGGAHVATTRFVVEDNPLCGVQMTGGGELDLHDGIVRRNRIGANVQTAGFDIARLQDRVIYVDNVVDLDTGSLPPPDPSVDVTPIE